MRGPDPARREGLRLLDRDGGDLALVLHLDVELGVAGPVHPLLEEALQAAAAHLFEGAHEVARLHHPALVAGEVGAHAAEEECVAQLAAEHVQHPAPLLVEVPVEEVDGRLVVLTLGRR